ncbi:hypothetical protein GCM10009840_14290 [Pseudolysinimonas kribbensis]|uniref:Uncharacterized protein n=1 Tax=Pseudolysinimonas kribbensis TaxID=433641 RepID=A0ABQ6K1B4_9MICO|nr:hypothetical protein GCM10025881_10770 [Pseudolysinimonas kribbensis]
MLQALPGVAAPVPVALLLADDPPAAAIGNDAELLHIDMYQRTWQLVLVTAGPFSGLHIDMREPVQAATDQHRVNG